MKQLLSPRDFKPWHISQEALSHNNRAPSNRHPLASNPEQTSSMQKPPKTTVPLGSSIPSSHIRTDRASPPPGDATAAYRNKRPHVRVSSRPTRGQNSPRRGRTRRDGVVGRVDHVLTNAGDVGDELDQKTRKSKAAAGYPGRKPLMRSRTANPVRAKSP